MAHAAEAAIGGLNASPHNAELAIPHLLAEQIVLGVKRTLVEAAEAVKGGFLKQHEHAGAEGLNQERSVLRDVVQKIERAVTNCALRAPDIGSHTMQPAALRQPHCSTQQRGILQLHVGVDKQHIRRGGATSSRVASN